MSGSVNKVILVGNLGRDPKIRTMQNGGSVANLSVATSDRWRDRQTGEPRERTEWHRVVIFDEKLAEIAEQHLRKGSKVYLEGELQTQKWTDRSNQERYTTEVVLQRFRSQLTMLGERGDSGGSFAGVADQVEFGQGRSPVETPHEIGDAAPGQLPGNAGNSVTARSKSSERTTTERQARRPRAKLQSLSARNAVAPAAIDESNIHTVDPRAPKPYARYIEEPSGSREDFKKDNARNWARSRRSE